MKFVPNRLRFLIILAIGFLPLNLLEAGPYDEDSPPLKIKNVGSSCPANPPLETMKPVPSHRPGGIPKPEKLPGPPASIAPPFLGGKSVTTRSAEFEKWLSEAMKQAESWNFPDVVNKYGKKITRKEFFMAIIYIESNGIHKNQHGQLTTSCVGARGFVQLMPDTAKGLGVNSSDPRQNLIGGAKYLKEVFRSPGVNNSATPEEKMIKAVCAYNLGPYSKILKRPWEKIKSSKIKETIGYGLKLKMCLGLELSATEKALAAQRFDFNASEADEFIDDYYSRTHGLVAGL